MIQYVQDDLHITTPCCWPKLFWKKTKLRYVTYHHHHHTPVRSLFSTAILTHSAWARWFKKRPWRRCPSHQCWESSPASFLLHPRIQATCDLTNSNQRTVWCVQELLYENFTLLCRGVVNGLVWVEFSGLLTEECEIERWMESRRSVATHYYSTTDLIKTFKTICWTKIWMKVSGEGKIFPKNMNK